jgi:serine/threonine protein kinase
MREEADHHSSQSLLQDLTEMKRRTTLKEEEDQSDHAPSILPPKPGDYRVGVLIAEGAFGRVVYAQHKTSGKEVAIKVVDRLSCRKRPFLVSALRREQALLRQLRDCRHIVKLLSSFVDDECVYVVLECCTGGTLEDLFWWRLFAEPSNSRSRQQTQTQTQAPGVERSLEAWSPRVAHYGRQILSGLQALHEQGYIHGDLKPSNILLTQQGVVCLADLGSARAFMGSTTNVDEDPANTPESPWHCTTTDYASPEVLRGTTRVGVSLGGAAAAVDAMVRMIAVDLWALGCLLWHAWYGQSPFHAASDALALDRIYEYAELATLEERRAWLVAAAAAVSPPPLGMDPAPEVWLDVILEFIHPCPEQRLGTIDKEHLISAVGVDPGGSACIASLHEGLSKHAVWASLSDETSPTLPSDYAPDWWMRQRRERSLRDGAIEGWTAYLD